MNGRAPFSQITPSRLFKPQSSSTVRSGRTYANVRGPDHTSHKQQPPPYHCTLGQTALSITDLSPSFLPRCIFWARCLPSRNREMLLGYGEIWDLPHSGAIKCRQIGSEKWEYKNTSKLPQGYSIPTPEKSGTWALGARLFRNGEWAGRGPVGRFTIEEECSQKCVFRDWECACKFGKLIFTKNFWNKSILFDVK